MTTRHPLAILNTSIATAPGDYEISPITLDQARELIADNRPIVSAVGHQATAAVLTELLGVEVPVNRIQFEQQPGQYAIVLKLRGRIPEGQILDVAGMDAIGYDLWLMTRRTRTLAEIRTDLDRCQHGRHVVDSCVSCPAGRSTGNTRADLDEVIGHTVHGRSITLGEVLGTSLGSPDSADVRMAEIRADVDHDNQPGGGPVR